MVKMGGLVHQTSRHGLAIPCCLPAPRSKVYLEHSSIIDTNIVDNALTITTREKIMSH